MISSLFSILIAIAVIGLIVWVLVTYIPMPHAFKQLIVAVAAIAVLLWLLKWAGLFA